MIDPAGVMGQPQVSGGELLGRMGCGVAQGRPGADAVGRLLGEIRITGTLSDQSVTWVRSNADHLGQATLRRLVEAVEVARAHQVSGFSSGGALLHGNMVRGAR